MELKVLASWLYAIQIFLNDNEHRLMVVINGNFNTACVAKSNCGIGKSNL